MDLSILFNKEGRCWLTLTAGLLNALDKSDKLIYHRICASSDSKLSDASFQNENSSICLEIFFFLGVCKPTNMGNYFPISKYWKVQINVITLLKLSTWQKHGSRWCRPFQLAHNQCVCDARCSSEGPIPFQRAESHTNGCSAQSHPVQQHLASFFSPEEYGFDLKEHASDL